MSGTVPPKEAPVCQSVGNSLPACSPPSPEWVGQKYTLTHQHIEKQLTETDFEQAKQEPE